MLRKNLAGFLADRPKGEKAASRSRSPRRTAGGGNFFACTRVARQASISRSEWSKSMSNPSGSMAKDARDAVRESGRAASAASGDIQADLEALRNDITRLANQVA